MKIPYAELNVISTDGKHTANKEWIEWIQYISSFLGGIGYDQDIIKAEKNIKYLSNQPEINQDELNKAVSEYFNLLNFNSTVIEYWDKLEEAILIKIYNKAKSKKISPYKLLKEHLNINNILKVYEWHGGEANKSS